MDTPLGIAAGNALEVTESIEVLQGGGPADVRELTLALAREMLALAGIEVDPATRLDDGSAHDAWRAMVTAQGGDPDAVLPEARHSDTVFAEADGYLSTLEARAVGIAAWRLGAGRARKEDPVSPTAGVLCLAKPGDLVRAGQPLLALLTDEPERFERAREALTGAIVITAEAPTLGPLVIDRIGS
jgi:thymidine phosphorylase